jgi:murein DD-endopeptidase MepM/ murein hydrolase activator NlpD
VSAGRVFTTIGVLSLLAACARETPPAPVVEGGRGALSTTPNRPTTGIAPTIVETAGGQVTVRQGQTLYAVARSAGVPVRSLIDANNLQPPYKLQAGKTLIIPHIRQHIVQPGESLYAVARRYGVEASSMAQLNHLTPPYTIKSGMPLILPPPIESATAPLALGAVTAIPLPPPAGVVAEAPTPATPPGQKPSAPASVPPVKPVEPEAAPAMAPPPPEPETAAVPQAGSTAVIVANHKPPVEPLFFWPVRGRMLSTFGPSAGGTHSDGINIAAPDGTTVSAAEDGVVAYAGNELRGFGNLLLVKHPDGWVTAYAHNQVLLVKKGDKVRRGQSIARVGKSGGVGETQLHFELRRGTKAIDPLDHLPQLTTGTG